MWPAGDAAGDAAHAARMLPPAVVLRTAAVRAALATLQLPFGQPVAPAVALGMQRLTELQGRLGAHPFQRLLAGQQDGGGSRYELGHGAQLAAPAAADLSAAVDAARALGDPAVAPVGVADDPIGGWLLRACGLRTAQPLADGSVFASALPSGGLVVDVTPDPEGELPLTLTARLESPGDATHDEPLGGVVAALAADGLTPVAEPAPLLAGILASDLSSTVGPVLSVLDLPHIVNVADVQTRLAAVPARDYVVVDLGATLTGEIVADPSQLAALLGQAARGGASSGLPVLTGTGTLALVLGVVDLPLAGNNLAGQHTVAYRWQVRGLVEHPVTLRPHRGATVTVSAAGEGISVVACTAYVRTGGNDPYQWTPTLPDGAVLALDQYEHVMNVVELVTPLGIRADTWAIRRRHVDVDGSGRPTPLSPSAARTYHRYRPMHA